MEPITTRYKLKTTGRAGLFTVKIAAERIEAVEKGSLTILVDSDTPRTSEERDIVRVLALSAALLYLNIGVSIKWRAHYSETEYLSDALDGIKTDPEKGKVLGEALVGYLVEDVLHSSTTTRHAS